MRITDEEFAKVQGRELEWWANTKFSVEPLYKRYTEVFAPYLLPFSMVADVGSGPIPYILSKPLCWIRAWAIDPLIIEYVQLDKHRDVLLGSPGSLGLATSTRIIGDEGCDGVFCLNTLDHVQDTYEMFSELARITAVNGRLFLFVDIGKDPDWMHPHKIETDWLLPLLENSFRTLLCKVERSWKFDCDVLWYIGEKQ